MLEQAIAKTLGKYRREAAQCLVWARDRLQILDVYDRLRTPPPGGRCFFAFRSSAMPGKPTKLIEVTAWTAPSEFQEVHNCLDFLRGSETWRLLCVANWLADHCLGVVPADGELLALEPEAHELHSCYVDFQNMLGMGRLKPHSLMRGMSFAALYTDRFCRLCLSSIRDAAHWDFEDDSVELGKVTVELGMDVRRLGEIRAPYR